MLKNLLLFTFALLLSNSTLAAQKILYVTDLEGDWEKWQDYMDLSGRFERLPSGLRLQSGYTFVFGGDAVDRYPGDLRVLSDLVSLAETQSSVILLGNRELNKMPLGDFTKADAALLQHFHETISAPKALRNRMRELQALGQVSSEAKAAESLLQTASRTGLLGRLFKKGRLATVIDQTLYVHGAWGPKTIAPPWEKIGLFGAVDLSRQVQLLNSWKDQQIEEWLQARGSRGERLHHYQGAKQGVIYGTFSDDSWKPIFPSYNFISTLKHQGIRRMVVGHRSYGPTPLVMRENEFELILADLSPWQGAATVLEIEGTRARMYSRKLSNGSRMDVSWDVLDPKSPIGKRTTDGQWITGQTDRGEWILYSNQMSFVPAEQIREKSTGVFEYVPSSSTQVPTSELQRVFAIHNDIARVAALKSFRGENLSSDQFQLLVERAWTLRNTYEIGEYIRLAREGRSAAMLPVLLRWEKQWTPPTISWQFYLLKALKEARTHITQSCRDVFAKRS